MFKDYVLSLKKEFAGYNGQKLVMDILAGLTVAAVAFAVSFGFWGE